MSHTQVSIQTHTHTCAILFLQVRSLDLFFMKSMLRSLSSAVAASTCCMCVIFIKSLKDKVPNIILKYNSINQKALERFES